MARGGRDHRGHRARADRASPRCWTSCSASRSRRRAVRSPTGPNRARDARTDLTRARPGRLARPAWPGSRRTRSCSRAPSRPTSGSAGPTRPPRPVRAAAHAAALDDVPLDRPVGERGSGLSAGQRRRVALARALLLRRPVAAARRADRRAGRRHRGPRARHPARRGRGRAGDPHRRAPPAVHRGRRLSRAARPGGRAEPSRPARPSHSGSRAHEEVAACAIPANVRQARIAQRPGRTAAGGAGRRRGHAGRGVLDRAAGHVGVADLPRRAAAARAVPHGPGRGGAGVRHRPGVFRYAERLASHDAALRILARLRMTAYGRLDRLAPAGLADVPLRRPAQPAGHRYRLAGRPVAPGPAALRRRRGWPAPGAVAVSAALLPSAGLILAAEPGRGRAGRAGARHRHRPPGGTPARPAPRRARGGHRRPAARRRRAVRLRRGGRALRDGRRATSAAGRPGQARSAYAQGGGAAVARSRPGRRCWGALVLGVPAVRAGTLAGVTLAVAGADAAGRARGVLPAWRPPRRRSRGCARAAARVADVLARPDPGRRAGPTRRRCRAALRPARAGADRPAGRSGRSACCAALDLDVPAGSPGRRGRAERLGQDDAGHGAAPVPRPGRRAR